VQLPQLLITLCLSALLLLELLPLLMLPILVWALPLGTLGSILGGESGARTPETGIGDRMSSNAAAPPLPRKRPGDGERAFPSCKRSILTEIYLCHACSYHEIEDGNARAGPAPWTDVQTLAAGQQLDQIVVGAKDTSSLFNRRMDGSTSPFSGQHGSSQTLGLEAADTSDSESAEVRDHLQEGVFHAAEQVHHFWRTS
jgi:hypothetical protein